MASNPDVFLQGLIGTTGLRPIQDVQIGQQQIQQNNQQLQMGQMAMAAAQQKAQQEAAFKQDTQTYFHNPTLQGLSALAAKYPDKADELKKTYDILDAPAKQSRVMVLGSLWNAANNGKPDLVARNLQNVITSEKAQGLDTSDAEAALAAVNSNNPTEQADAIKFVKAFAQMHLAAADPGFLKASGVDDNQGHFKSTGDSAIYDDRTGQITREAPPKPIYKTVDVFDAEGNKVGTREIEITPGGGGQAPAAAQAPAAQRRVSGWSPRKRDGGDNSDAAVDGKIGAISKDIGVGPDTPLTPEQLRLVGTALPATEGGPGSLADKNNNPSNIRDGSFARHQPGYVGRGEGGFAKFDTKASGQAATQTLLQSYYNRGQRTIRDIIEGKPVAGGPTQPRAPGARTIYESSGTKPPEAMSPAAIDNAAQVYNVTGQLPPSLGRGGKVQQQILSRAAELAGGTDVPGLLGNRAGYRADTGALVALQRQSSQIQAFESTAIRNGALAQRLATQVDNGNVPLFNSWVNAGRKATGDPKVSAFNAAVEVFTNEFAKVTSGATGGSVTSDSARQHARDLINSAQSPQQFTAVLNTLREDMENRRKGLDEQRSTLLRRISGNGADQSEAPGSSQAHPVQVQTRQDALQHRGQWIRTPTGQVVKLRP